MIICGDFNSIPDSGVYRFIKVIMFSPHLVRCVIHTYIYIGYNGVTSLNLKSIWLIQKFVNQKKKDGRLDGNHPDFCNFDYGRYTRYINIYLCTYLCIYLRKPTNL